MRTIIGRVLLGIIIFLAAVILLLIGSIIVDGILQRGQIDFIANTIMPGHPGAPEVHAFVARPDGAGPFPVVIMIHEFYGLNEKIAAKASGLAEEGYLVIAPDTFRGASTSWVPSAIYQVISTPAEQVNQDLDTVFQWILAHPEADSQRVAVLGFCYGGRASLNYSLHNNRLAATVIFYGSPVTDPAVLQRLPGPLLGIFGSADQSIPVSAVNDFDAALTTAGVPHEITVYQDQPHAFLTSMDAIRAGGVQGQAWEQMLGFLDQNLRPNTGQPQFLSGGVSLPLFELHYYLMLAYEHAFGSTSHLH